jgi:cysteine synthase
VMDDMVEGVKSAAETMGRIAEEAVGIEPEQKIWERIVPVPHADVYSSAPFRLIERNGLPVGTSAGKAA